MEKLTRRRSLARLSGLFVAAGSGSLLRDSTSGNAAIESGAVSCVLTPELPAALSCTRGSSSSPTPDGKGVRGLALLVSPGPDLLNAQDSIFVNGGKRTMLRVKKVGNQYVAWIEMGVRR